MITVEYKILQDEKDQVINQFTKSFETDEARQQYEDSQRGHPFLTLKAMKISTPTGADNV
jgi:hypothetical protein